MFSKYLSSNKSSDFSWAWLIFLVTVVAFDAFIGYNIINQIREKKIITIECKLLNRSTEFYRVQHNFTTFNCGNYGILVSENEEIFRKAKENNKLNVYFGKHDYEIFSIRE
jgi:hypothetical protein